MGGVAAQRMAGWTGRLLPAGAAQILVPVLDLGDWTPPTGLWGTLGAEAV